MIQPELLPDPTTEEETEINRRIEEHIKWIDREKFVQQNMIIACFIGPVLWAVGSGALMYTGVTIMLIAFLLFLSALATGAMESKKRYEVTEVLLPYMKEKARPLFERVRDKFADDDDIQVTLTDSGDLRIIHRKKREGKEMK